MQDERRRAIFFEKAQFKGLRHVSPSPIGNFSVASVTFQTKFGSVVAENLDLISYERLAS
jgi:hypothetical protein